MPFMARKSQGNPMSLSQRMSVMKQEPRCVSPRHHRPRCKRWRNRNPSTSKGESSFQYSWGLGLLFPSFTCWFGTSTRVIYLLQREEKPARKPPVQLAWEGGHWLPGGQAARGAQPQPTASAGHESVLVSSSRGVWLRATPRRAGELQLPELAGGGETRWRNVQREPGRQSEAPNRR